MLFKCLKVWLGVLGLLGVSIQSDAQCFSFAQSQIPPNSSFVVPLIIEGAAIDDLSAIDQCVEAVSLSFSHPRLSELEIFLISPFGDTLTLVSGGGGTFAATNNTNWNITFLPCDEMAIPDNDFNPNFTNTENWGVFGNYSGLYYPHEGCLEDFDEGPVNGTWQLLIVNNSVFNAGMLTGFSLFFCNGDGLDCFVCQAAQSNITLPDVEYCEGSDDLLLTIGRSFVGFAPDPNDYGYLYFLFQDSIVASSSPFIDLRDSTSGEYKVCGLSYLLADSMSLPPIGEKIDFQAYRSTLTSDTAALCGRLSNCLDVFIFEPIDTTFEDKFLCMGDTLFMGMDTLTVGGIYDITVPSSSACDSIVQVDLTIVNLELAEDINIGLDCSMPEATLRPSIISSNIDPQFLTYVWIDEAGDTLSMTDSLIVTEAGIYVVNVSVIIDGNFLCSYSSSFTITLASDDYDPALNLPEAFCLNATYEIALIEPLLGTNYMWSLNPDQDLIGPSDSSVFVFNFSNPVESELCVQLENPCFQDTLICSRISLNMMTEVGINATDTVCGVSTLINTSGLTDVAADFVSGSSLNIDFDIMGADILATVVERGLYNIEISGLNNGCPFDSIVSVLFLPMPELGFEIEIVNDCIQPGISIVSDNPTMDVFQIFGSLNGIPFDFISEVGETRYDLNLANEGVNTILLISYQYEIFPSCELEIQQEITVNLSPILIFPDLIRVCNDSIGQLESRVDLSGAFNYPVEILSIELDGFEGEIDIPAIGFQDVLPGIYDFRVILNPGGGCPEIDTLIRVMVEDCSCPFLRDGDVVYDFCGSELTDLNDFILGEWSIRWETVTVPDGAVLSIEDGVMVFTEFRAGPYEFLGVIDDPPEGCDEEITLFLNAIPAFNAGEAIQADTFFICLEGEGQDRINLFDYIQNYDDGGRWSTLSASGISGTLNDQIGLFILTESGIATATFSYSSASNNSCGNDSTILIFEIYRMEAFDIPDQIVLSCDEDFLEIDLEKFNQLNGFELVITGNFEMVNGTSSIRIRSAGLIQFEFSGGGDKCVFRYDVSVGFSDNPIADLNLNIFTPLCANEDGDGFVEVIEIFGGIEPYEVELNGLQIQSAPYIFSGLSSGTYLLKVNDSNGCTFDSLIILEIDQTGFISLGEDRFATSGALLNIDYETNLSPSNISTIRWELEGELICEGCSSVQINAAQGLMVVLTVIDLNGCIYMDSLFIFADIQVPFYLPNAFSPNFDNVNDRLFMYPRAGLVEVLEWKIFDRWGSAVFESGPFNPFLQEIGWDGRFNGQTVLPGTYISSIRYLLSNGRTSYHVSEVNVLR